MYRKKRQALLKWSFVIIGLVVISYVIVPKIAHSGRACACCRNIEVINKQAQIYYVETGQWPRSLKVLVERYPEHFPDGIPECPFGQVYARNPRTKQILSHNH